MSAQVKRYRKKPVVIEAMIQDGTRSGAHAVESWARGTVGGASFHRTGKEFVPDGEWHVYIPTLEGVMTAKPGDYVIKGVHGEFYPCDPEIFAKTYEELAP